MQMDIRSGREGRPFHLHLPLFSLSCASGPKERKPLRRRRGQRPGRRSRACPVMGMRLPAPRIRRPAQQRLTDGGMSRERKQIIIWPRCRSGP